ncbi:hypothetical protein FJT64_020138 [Amphibalanus amphitrite]|uniref:Uncharacterized protein n=1 Tax=Amphibalanus amphitrite TaxID=1232801 RepID=A0A6A4VR25_AMPAM|nr:hypothetical protein FJT64_008933 [Amphibalanus amphitrite]KAF0308687.1 hypothetical protein FJT64_020138 [Amphibalanus amphitrite]
MYRTVVLALFCRASKKSVAGDQPQQILAWLVDFLVQHTGKDPEEIAFSLVLEVTLQPTRSPPWEVTACPHVTFGLDIEILRLGASADGLRRAARRLLIFLLQRATWVWTDGSADAGVHCGGAGVFVDWPDD